MRKKKRKKETSSLSQGHFFENEHAKRACQFAFGWSDLTEVLVNDAFGRSVHQGFCSGKLSLKSAFVNLSC